MRALIPRPVMEKISAALSLSVDHAFLWALLPVFFALLSVSMMGAGRMQFAQELPPYNPERRLNGIIEHSRCTPAAILLSTRVHDWVILELNTVNIRRLVAHESDYYPGRSSGKRDLA
ncbi:hypothetical protein CM49_02662 [Paenibacillus sp. P1XP2]|nr:hypothetical protein CM49_02662 [Paenibacillus sp. P1XP2]